MKLRELIEQLEAIEQDLIAGLGDDVEPEVVAAYQRAWPLCGEVLHTRVLHDDDEPILVDAKPVVWLAIGSHPDNMNPYAPRAAFTEAS